MQKSVFAEVITSYLVVVAQLASLDSCSGWFLEGWERALLSRCTSGSMGRLGYPRVERADLYAVAAEDGW